MLYLNFLAFLVLSYLVLYQYKRSGVLLTPGCSILVMRILIPVYVAYPFAATRRSLEMIGQVWNAHFMALSIDELWTVATVGTLAGIVAYRLAPRVFPRLFARFTLKQVTFRPILSDLTLGACFSILLGVGLVWMFYLYTSEIPLLSSDPNYVRTSIGPRFHVGIYITGMFLPVLGVTFLLAGLALKRVTRYKSFCYAVLSVWFVTTLLTATRTPLFAPLVLAALLYFSLQAKKFGLLRIALWGVGVAFSLAALQAIRHGTGLALGGVIDELVYGGTNSTLRDNAFLLMGFHHYHLPLYWGKTIVAGFMTIIPSRWSEFRQVYGWGAVTRDLIHNQDPSSLAGLGHICFGDWYLNFGYPGIIIEGLLMGVVFRLLDSRLLHLLSVYKRSEKYDYHSFYKIWLFWLVASAAFSSGESDFITPYLLGLAVMLAVAKAIRVIFSRNYPSMYFQPPMIPRRSDMYGVASSSPGLIEAPHGRVT